MAEISQDSGGKNKSGKKQAKKMSTRIDLTPMVDLGFLLITFFMLTTTLNKPKTMQINMPVKPDNPEEVTKIADDIAMTVILGEKDRVFYYFGLNNPEIAVEVTTFDDNTGIRKILREKNSPQIVKIDALRKRLNAKEFDEVEFKRLAGEVKADKRALVVLIKSDEKAKYKNLVDILDEMKINDIGKYAIVDLSPVEAELIKGL